MNILGIDFGEKNIGLAIARDGFVFPLTNLKYQKNHVLENDAIKFIVDLVLSEKIDVIVFGDPNNKLAGLSPNGENMREFGARLKAARIRDRIDGKLRCQIRQVKFEFISEYKTSKDAVSSQIELGISKKASRGTDHSFAAAEILKRYLEP